MKKLMMIAVMAAAFAFSTEANAQEVKVMKKDVTGEVVKPSGVKAEVAPQSKKVVKQREAATLTAEPQKAIQRKEVATDKKLEGTNEKKVVPVRKRMTPTKPVEPKSQDISKELK